MSQENYHWQGGGKLLVCILYARRCSLLISAFFVCLLLAWVGETAQASTQIPAQISGQIIWTSEGNPYLLNQTSTIKSGSTLTIETGVIIKASNGGILNVEGELNINGSDSDQVYFTSIKDDTLCGDTNNDANNSQPAGGDWPWIQFLTGSRGIINYAQIRYGGYSWWFGRNDAQVVVDHASPKFNHITILDGSAQSYAMRLNNSDSVLSNSIISNHKNINGSAGGLLIDYGNLQIQNNKFHYNDLAGLVIRNLNQSNSLVLKNNDFEGNGDFYKTHFGLRTAIQNHSSIQIDATNNWWGDGSGPMVLSNPTGIGEGLVGLVLYDPWTGKEIPNESPIFSWVGEDGYLLDGIEPNLSYDNNKVLTFKIRYQDKEGLDPEYIKVYIDGNGYDLSTTEESNSTSSGRVYFIEKEAAPIGTGKHSYHFEASDGFSIERIPQGNEFEFEIKKNPIVIIPGLLSSELQKDSQTIWLDLWNMFLQSRQIMSPLFLDSYGKPTDRKVEVGQVIQKKDYVLGTVHMFDLLIDNIISQGYQLNEDLYLFPYDWRIDIRETSLNLQNQVSEIIKKTGAPSVNIIAHSMGGLVAKNYIINNPASHSIGKLIFIGVPHLGAPKAMKALLFGDNFGLPGVILDKTIMRELALNMFSLYQLLPTINFFGLAGGYFYDISNAATEGKLFNYEQTRNWLIDRNYNSQALNAATSLHGESLDNFNALDYKIEAYNISGCGRPTITGIMKKNEPGMWGRMIGDSEYMINLGDGDETVPLVSASHILSDSGRNYYVSGVKHSLMPSNDRVVSLIERLITKSGSEMNDLPNGVSRVMDNCGYKGKLISVHSPVDLGLVDSNGEEYMLNDYDIFSDSKSQIFYENIDNNKFLFIPESLVDNYKIRLKGTDDGLFNLRISDVTAGNINKTEFYRNIPVGLGAQGEMVIGNDKPSDLKMIDSLSNEKNVVDKTAILSNLEHLDLNPPQTTIDIVGKEESKNGRYQAPVKLRLSTLDNYEGVESYYKFNDDLEWSLYSREINVNKNGSHSIKYFSIDKSGNIEKVKNREFVVEPEEVASLLEHISHLSGAGTGGMGVAKLDTSINQVVDENKSKEIDELPIKQPKVLGLTDYVFKEEQKIKVSDKSINFTDLYNSLQINYNNKQITKYFIKSRLEAYLKENEIKLANLENKLTKTMSFKSKAILLAQAKRFLRKFLSELKIRRGKYVTKQGYDNIMNFANGYLKKYEK